MVKTKPKEDVIKTTLKSECKVVNVNGRAKQSRVLTVNQNCGVEEVLGPRDNGFQSHRIRILTTVLLHCLGF